MDDVRLGSLFRALRIRKGWRQADLAARVRVSRGFVSLVERGHSASVSVRALRRVAAALEVSLDVVPRWRGGDAARILNAGHATLHESIAQHLDSVGGWVHSPEVSFSIFGERGVIDILAFHRESASLLVIELKTELVDVEDLLATMDRRMRLARAIAAERGWVCTSVSGWVVIAESDMNRRLLRRYAATLRAAFPGDGRAVRAWLRHPAGRELALSMWANANRVALTRESRLEGGCDALADPIRAVNAALVAH